MGQGLSCAASQEHGFFTSVQLGELDTVNAMIERDPSLLHQTTYDSQYPLHIAAANGQIEILTMLLERSVDPDMVNRHKQTPLMLAAMHGKISCLIKLIEAGANHLLIRDGRGATPLHLAARQRRPGCVHILLDNGALVCASTEGYGSPGSTPLHLAARGGSLDCTRKLLAWGADRLQRDASGRIPYVVALKYRNGSCAALLNPTSAEPLVWPSPLKFISELSQETKTLLECALMEANREREKNILKGTGHSLPSPSHSVDGTDSNISEASDTEVCCICFEQVCTIEVQDCGHQMCAQCTLALCCHNKPNPTTACLNPPVCPFCRSNIARLVVAKIKNCNDADQDFGEIGSPKLRKSRKSRNFSEGSSSFKGLSATFGKMGGRGSGRIAAENEWMNKS
ncbi:hypothetical protein OIU76_014710 [Salix suchowensis]|nr:hypothetical protein OIU76_014710 [Salix suchowensis]